ncbi:hypothetical protein NDU88_005567 [Pleurodeles waltl]|uniref:Motilin/ghrelin-associated peptide domain-containing protein n=1 Tax=Pleurodeles waltl TaxID=8319 RepID=A0AAV7QI80_PLEWA|nr:hypothetical protein NDU88_005567 [Pleurodeles waltl]
MIRLVPHEAWRRSYSKQLTYTHGKAKEKNRAMKKSLRSEDGELADISSYDNLEEDEIIKLKAPVEFGMRLSARQMEKYRVALEGLLQGMLPEPRNGKDVTL